MSMVNDALFNEEARRKDNDVNNEEAFVTEGRGRQIRENQSGWRGRSKSRGNSTDRRDKSVEGWKPRCYQCGMKGHLKRDYRRLRREQDPESSQARKDGETQVTVVEEVVAYAVQEELCIVESSGEVEWTIDTVASCHATHRRDIFTTYEAGDFGTVKMGNTSGAKIVGFDDVQIVTDVGCRVTLKDVQHVPDLRLNLLSV